MAHRLFLAGLLATALPHSLAADDLRPSKHVAHRRGPEIFNAVHNAMRQWGSSLHHNGMSFFLATVPEGVLFHHGNSSPDSPTDPDWLAYEIEHAEHFARGRSPGGGGPGRGPPGRDGPGGGPSDRNGMPEGGEPGRQQVEIGELKARDASSEDEEAVHGYLHTYRTSRTLQFLYVDGMGGGKTSMGTLDSQDYLLRDQKAASMAREAEHDLRMEEKPRSAKKPHGKRAPGGPMDEQQRAIELCKLCKEWDLQGIVRMEAGFEIIYCDFSDGLDVVQTMQRPDQTDNGRGGGGGGGPGGMSGDIEFVRGLSERYQGIGSTRTIIDYSSMVSAFFFPVNLTNPDPKRLDLPRLSATTEDELEGIRAYLDTVIEERRGKALRTIDWQDVSDLIVGRYADRLKYMAEVVDSIDVMARELNFLLTVFIDYAEDDADFSAAIGRCTNFYLGQVAPVTEADRLIHTGFSAVTREICTTLFRARNLVVVNPVPDQSSLAAASSALRSLMSTLAWTRFKRCSGCAIDEVCLVPMWPMGTVEDYKKPRCTNGSDTREGENYWGGFGGGPGRGGRGRGPPAMD